MRKINLILAAISCLMIGSTQKPSSPVCFNSLPGDTNGFGLTLAVNDKYLAVGDLGKQANRVVIYRRDKNDKWIRTREILPPKDSTAYKVGSGFGHQLALDGDVLVVSAFTVIDPQNNEVTNPKDFQESNIYYSTSTALYQTQLDRETEVKLINLPDVPTKGAISPGSVVTENGKIGFILSQEEQPGKRINQVYVVSNGKAHALPNGKLEYIFPSKVSRASIYGSDIALKNNLLLVSIDQSSERGGVWLFDLNSPQSNPQKLTIPNATPPLSNSVAISERFVAVGNFPLSIDSDLSDPFETTLIRNIATGSTKVIDEAGGLSLDGNILARIRSIGEDLANNEGREISRLLEVFRLDDDATPHLIQKRGDVERAFLQNRLLITVQKTNSGKKICTEKVR
jgi:hypothetical protein